MTENSAVEHEFGSQHTEIKLSVVEGYLKAFTASLRPHFKTLVYFDAFAGTGARTERVAARDQDLIGEAVPEQVSHRRGSARIALEIKPAFDRLFFMEQNPKHCEALEQLKSEFPDRMIDVLPGNANSLIKKILCRIEAGLVLEASCFSTRMECRSIGTHLQLSDRQKQSTFGIYSYYPDYIDRPREILAR